MKKGLKIVLLIVYIIIAGFAIYYGWVRNFLVTAIFLGALFLVGILIFILSVTKRHNDEASYIPVRSVKLEKSKEVVDGQEVEPQSKVALVHVDEAASDKIVIKVFKELVPITDAATEVNS